MISSQWQITYGLHPFPPCLLPQASGLEVRAPLPTNGYSVSTSST